MSSQKKISARKFYNSCMCGNLPLVKTILRTSNIIIDFDNAFHLACKFGHLEVAQLLLRVEPYINISFSNDYTFRLACENGHLETVKWLLQVKPDINISASHEYAFNGACARGHLEVAQWLLQVKPDICICDQNDWAFRHSCDGRHLVVAQWLADEMKPERYEITDVTTNERGFHRIHYTIYKNNDRPLTDYVLK